VGRLKVHSLVLLSQVEPLVVDVETHVATSSLVENLLQLTWQIPVALRQVVFSTASALVPADAPTTFLQSTSDEHFPLESIPTISQQLLTHMKWSTEVFG